MMKRSYEPRDSARWAGVSDGHTIRSATLGFELGFKCRRALLWCQEPSSRLQHGCSTEPSSSSESAGAAQVTLATGGLSIEELTRDSPAPSTRTATGGRGRGGHRLGSFNQLWVSYGYRIRHPARGLRAGLQSLKYSVCSVLVQLTSSGVQTSGVFIRAYLQQQTRLSKLAL